MTTAGDLIEQLGPQPHPEGGWYAETWREPAMGGERASSTAIHFLLEAGQESHWHRVDAAEIWLWQAGDTLELSTAPSDSDPVDSGPIDSVRLGHDLSAGEQVQHVIAPGECQVAQPDRTGRHGHVLVSCVVAPGFAFGGFELAPPNWAPGAQEA